MVMIGRVDVADGDDHDVLVEDPLVDAGAVVDVELDRAFGLEMGRDAAELVDLGDADGLVRPLARCQGDHVTLALV